MTFLNCTFPQALVANGYPYDVGTATTTFMRPWGKDGMTAAINCAIGSQFSAAAYQTFGNTNETECRAREYGTTLIGGSSLNIPQIRWNAGTYWANTIDPDYTNNPSLLPTDALLAPPTGTNNRVVVTVNPNDYTLTNIFGNSYFNLNGWMPAVAPVITSQPANQSVSAGAAVTFTDAATGLPNPTFQWQKNGANIVGATNAALSFVATNVAGAGTYSVIVSNSAGITVSSNATLTVANSAPSLVPVSNQTINAGMTLNVTNLATDIDMPPQTLTFSLLTGPSNSLLNANGVFNWRPSVSQAGTINPVSVVVTDNGTPNLSATNHFTVTVNALTSPTAGSPSYAGGQFSVSVGGQVGPDYYLQANTNLSGGAWTTVATTNSPATTPIILTDPNAGSQLLQFYRIVTGPPSP